MKFIILILSFFLISQSIFCQEDEFDSSEKVLPVINSLEFPYKDGYQMIFQGKSVVFDNYNFPRETTKKSMKYSFYPYKSNIKKLSLCYFDKNDTQKFLTYLKIDESGMSYWLDNDSAKIKEKHPTQAVLLPLFTGKKWKTWFNDFKTTAECVTTDTVIMTRFGEKNVFGIRYHFQDKRKKVKKMTYCYEVTEFYDPAIGKVYSRCLQYLDDKKNNKKIKLYEDEFMLVEYFNLKP